MGALWTAALVLPLVAALIVGLCHRAPSPRARRLASITVTAAPVSLIPAGALAVVGPEAPLEIPWLFLGMSVSLDITARALLLVAVLLYGAAAWAVTWSFDRRAPELIGYLLASFVGNVGVYLADDVVTFYVAFSLMSLAAVGLIVHDRTKDDFRATRIYLVMTIIGEMVILAGLALVTHAGSMLIADAPAAVAGSDLRGLIVVLLVVGFGIKAGLLGMHMWLPLAHPAAPPPGSAVLSGAMVKAGLVGMIRFLPLGEVSMPTAGTIIAGLSLAGAFLAVPVGVIQRDPKVILAYSTISQMGFLGVLIGVALANPDLAAACITAALIYAVHHGLAKGALFLGVPVWKHHATGTRRHLVYAGMVLAGLAVAGAPLSSGAVGKYAGKEAVAGLTLLGVDLVNLLPLVATGTTVLLIRLGWILYHTDLEPLRPGEDPELPAWLVLVVTSATVPWLVSNAWIPLESVPDLDPVTIWDASWPILLGLALGAIVWWVLPRKSAQVALRLRRALPPGDVVVVAEKAVREFGRILARVAATLGSGRSRVLTGLERGQRATMSAGRAVADAEQRLSAWVWSGIGVIAILAVLTAVAWGRAGA